MKKINKKGFTLVELLAVVVILGVLLMIAVPSVTNIINSSRDKAFLSQAKLAVENVETSLSMASDSEKPTDSCDIPITSIKLDRGSWDGYEGNVTVQKLPAADSDGKMYSVTINLSDGTRSVTGKTLAGITGVDSSYAAATTPTANSCTFYK